MAVNESRDRARLRQAITAMRAAGIANPEHALRLGAAEMVERCLARFPGEPRLAVRAILDGGVIFDDQPASPQRETASDWLQQMNRVAP